MLSIIESTLPAVDAFVHLSGVENMARALYEKEKDAAQTAAFVFDYLSEAIVSMSLKLRERYGSETPIVYAGGVMSNGIIREKVTQKINGAYFAAPAFSADNAAGIALLTEERYKAQYDASAL